MTRRIRGSILGLFLLGLLLPVAPIPADPAAAAVDETLFHRVAGEDRFATAAEVARRAFAAPTGRAVLALGTDFPDALSAAYLAGRREAPILLTARDRLPSATRSVLADLEVQHVEVVGGPAAISAEVIEELRGLGVEVTRVGGEDRYGTSAAVAARGPSSGIDIVFIASGTAFADGLAAGPIAFAEGYPLLLTAPQSLPVVTSDALRRLNPASVVVLGGTAAVAPAVETAIVDLGFAVSRIGGVNRQDTAHQLAVWAVEHAGFDASRAGLARGDAFPDALASAPLGGHERAPLLLADGPEVLGSAAAQWLAANAALGIRGSIYGGTAAISDDVARAAEAGAQLGSGVASAVPVAGTTMAEVQDVVSIDGTSEDGAVVLLKPGPSEPTVGGHLAVPSIATHPEGVYGRVEALGHTSDGFVRVQLVPASVRDGFANIGLDYDGLLTPEAVQSGGGRQIQAWSGGALQLATPPTSAFKCEGKDAGELEPVLELKFENLSVNSYLDVAGRDMLFQLNGEAVVDLKVTGSLAKVTCTLDPAWRSKHQLQITLPTNPPVVLELSPLVEFEVSGGADVGWGSRIYFSRGFEYRDGQYRDIKAGSASPYGNLRGYVEANLFVGADFAVKIWDVAGVFLKFGPEFKARGEISTAEACAIVSVGARADFGLRLDVWIAKVDRRMVTVNLFEHEFLRKCFPSDDGSGGTGGSGDGSDGGGGSDGGSGSTDPEPAPDGASIRLARGEPAPYGYRYDVTLAGFQPNASVSVTCHDSADPQGFFVFSLVTDGNGNAHTGQECYSADGPEHWVTAAGVTSNVVSWSGSATTPPAPSTQGTVTLAQGPVAPYGYRYAVTLKGFSPNTGIAVSCHDSVDPGGFYNFTMTTDGAGNAYTAQQCYSADGPDHWVIAGGVESNHVTWGSGSDGGGGGTATPKITLSQGAAAPSGYWYAVSLSGFPANTGVTVTCRDSVDPGGFYSQTLTTNSSGGAADSTLCYSADGPDHWVTGGGVESNHVSWGSGSGGGGGTATPKITLARGAAAQYGYWYSVSLSGWPANTAVTVTCRDSVDPGGFYSQTLTTNSSGNASDSTLCYSGDGPDHWVTGGGVESNHVSW